MRRGKERKGPGEYSVFIMVLIGWIILSGMKSVIVRHVAGSAMMLKAESRCQTF
jgi:hypothetical protein